MGLLAFRAVLVASSAAASPAVGPVAPPRAEARDVEARPGSVPILMYHRTGPTEERMVRSAANFREDLNRLYAMGFRPVTLAQFAKDEMPLKPGQSPVVITFDDSHASQYRVMPDGSVDPGCFVGIWKEFARRRPDFPVRATFFVNANGPFEQPEHARRKIRDLVAMGSEVGWHTSDHPDLSKVGDETVRRQMGEGFPYLARFGVVPETFALPYGALPKNRSLLKGFWWKGRLVKFRAVVLAGSEPAAGPAKPAELLRLNRIQAYPGILGVDYWLNRYRDGRAKAYLAGGRVG
jgi:peptidoglycan/xylan/chitin deacetylase (PgdA/CDA1 family)